MVLITAPGAPVTSIRRLFEAYTLAFVAAQDNDDTWVSMHNITGRGRWVGAGYVSSQGVANIEIRHNIDGAGLVSGVFASQENGGPTSHFAMMSIGFETSLVVDMRLTAAEIADFTSVALVE